MGSDFASFRLDVAFHLKESELSDLRLPRRHSPIHMPPVVPAPTVAADDARAFEAENVHGVYDAIASHFSSTRYKPWPIIAEFMGSLAAGSVGLDSGCGNGKYLALGAPDALTIGLDRSVNLLHIARNAGEHPRDVVLADALDDCWRPGAFVRWISTYCAEKHADRLNRCYRTTQSASHACTIWPRLKDVDLQWRNVLFRCSAFTFTLNIQLQSLLRAVSPTHGRALIYVWATDQDALSKRVVPEQGSDGTKAQDVFVPWVRSGAANPTESTVLQRYYHLFAPGELSNLVHDAASHLGLLVRSAQEAPSDTQGLEIVREGWERSNWYVEIRRWTTAG